MADLKIYNNGENKVLMSAGNRIIQQPFEFGRSFKNVSNSECLELDTVFFDNKLSVTFWLNDVTLSVTTFMSFLDNSNLEIFRLDLTGDNRHRVVVGGANITNSRIVSTKNFFEKFKYDGVTASFTAGNIKFDLNSAPVNIDILSISKVRLYGKVALDYVTIANRELSDSEFDYMYNNGLARNPQSLDRFNLLSQNNEAEIFENTYVGVKNEIVGQSNLKIINLPAGSIADQLAFANANLFVPFIK